MANFSALPVPGTNINIYDKTPIIDPNVGYNNGPVFLCAAGSPEGPEEITELTSVEQFRRIFTDNGTVNFKKYGLPLYMVDEILESGSRVLFKRIVSNEATLSNIGIVAVVNKIENQKVNGEGQPLYLTPSGEETTEQTSRVPNPNHKPLVLTANTNIIGTTNEEMNLEVTVTLTNDTFTGVTTENITSWFTSEQDIHELTFTVSRAPSGNNDNFAFTVTGTPTADISGAVKLTIPADKTTRGKSVSTDIPVSIDSRGGAAALKKTAPNSTKKPQSRTENSDDEFLVVENQPIMLTKAAIQFGAKYIKDCKNMGDVEHGFDVIYKGPEKVEDDPEARTATSENETIEDLPDAELPNSGLDSEYSGLDINEDSYVFPLILITSKGRGISNHRIRIVPDYTQSKHSEYFRYRLEIIKNGAVVQQTYFALDPDFTIGASNKNIETMCQDSPNINVKVLPTYFDEFFSVVQEFSGLDKSTINKGICITDGKDKSGKPVEKLKISGVNLQHTFGIRLSGGDFGTFGNTPNDITKNEDYINLLESFYRGDTDDDVWKKDELFFNIIADANYDQKVKRAIEYLCKTRGDVSCLLDMGTSLTEFNDFVIEKDQYAKDYVVNIYYQYGEIVDKFSKRKITTTLPMLMAKKMKEHFIAGRSKPMAGVGNGFTFPEFTKVSHIPKETPRINEKDILAEHRINFGVMHNGIFTLETNYTNQEPHTQLSYSSNVLAIQHLIQDLRRSAPEVRYRSLSANELAIQKDKYESTCKRHLSDFEMCEFVYEDSEEDRLRKTFRGRIIVVCKDFTMREEFDIFVVHRDDANGYRITVK